MAAITGSTRVYGIVADPIRQVKAPQGLNAIMAERGVDGVLVPFHVGAADLATFFASLRVLQSFHGMIVTVPHKTAALPLCDAVSERATLVGAVNVVRRQAEGRLVGDILDGIGFIAGLATAGIEAKGMRTYLAGAGGAGNAVAFALVEAGVSHLTIANRTRDRAEDLRRRLLSMRPGFSVEIGSADPRGHDLVVNTTSLGMRETDQLPLDGGGLERGMIVAESIMQPETTPLLAQAEAAGCRVHRGWPMLASQLALMADFLGMRP